MVASEDEQARITLSQHGDHDAFESLIKEYQKMILALCYRMTGSMADAEDLAQETFIHAFQSLDRFRSESKFSSWLYRIAANQCLNWRKASDRREQVHKRWGARTGEENSQAPQATLVQEALLKLPAKQLAALVLTTYDGLNHADAARALGCSETTVSWRVFAARRKLKKLLKHLAL